MKEVLKITLIVFSSSLLLFILSFVGATSYGYYLLKEPIKMKGLPVAVPILLDKEDWPKTGGGFLQREKHGNCGLSHL